MLDRFSPRIAAVVVALAIGLWVLRPFQGADSQTAPQELPSSSAPDSGQVLGEGEATSVTAKVTEPGAGEAEVTSPTDGVKVAAANPPSLADGEAKTADTSATAMDVDMSKAASESSPASVPTPPIPVQAQSELVSPAGGAAASAKLAPAPAFSFKDVRPLTAATEPAAPAAPASAAVASVEVAGSQGPKPAASFQDTRPLPGLEPDNSKTAGKSDEEAPSAAKSADASFQDVRPLAAASFQDGRLVTPPSFRDERPVAAPSFQDERLVTQPAFRDARPVAAPSFKDARPLAPDATLPDKQPATPEDETAVAAAATTAAAPPSQSVQPEATTVAQGPLPTLIAVSPSAFRLEGNSGCKETEISTEALDGGQMRIRIAASCHPGEAVQVSYGGAEFIRKLDSFGSLDFILDCFAGSASAAEVRMNDGTRKTLPVVAKDLDKVSKIAVVWRAAANLDLHVFEYGARDDEAGHIWAKSPSSIGSARIQAQTDKRGHGLLGAIDDGQSLGDKVEVYTFVHNDEQSTGAISMALDYESRGEKPSGATCGSGALAEVDFQVNILPRNGQVSRQTGVLTRVECGTVIPREARFNQSALPVLRIKK